MAPLGGFTFGLYISNGCLKNLRQHILESFTSHQTSAEMCFALEKLCLKVWFCFSSSSLGSPVLLRSLTTNLLLVTQES